MDKEIAPQVPQGGPAKTPGEQTYADQAAAAQTANAAPRGILGATAADSFHAAVSKRIAESDSELSPEEWTDLARSAFFNAAGHETPRPAPNAVPGVFPRFAAPDPTARLPSAADVLNQMPSNLKAVSRGEFEKVGKEVLATDPDDIRVFFNEVLDRVFGRADH